MKEGKAEHRCKCVSGSGQIRVGRQVVMFSSAMATESTIRKVNLKELPGYPHVFRKPLRPIPSPSSCPFGPDARETDIRSQSVRSTKKK
jgi:hypothetical protein